MKLYDLVNFKQSDFATQHLLILSNDPAKQYIKDSKNRFSTSSSFVRHMHKRSIEEPADLRFRGCREDHDSRIRIGLTSGDRFLCYYSKFCPCKLEEEPEIEVSAKGGVLFYKSPCCVTQCTINFRIQAPVGYELVLEFLDMRVSRVKTENSDGTHVCFDTNLFFIGDWYRFCGDKPPPPLRVMRRRVDFMLALRHNSYCPSGDEVTFTLRYRACSTTDVSSDVCPSQLVYTTPGLRGYVTSPGFDWVGNYPSNTHCLWNISVERGYAIRMRFKWFRLPSFSDLDNLKIYGFAKKDNASSAIIALQFTGKEILNIPEYTVLLPGNTAAIEFVSDDEDSSKGFKINFEAVDSDLYIPIVDELTLNCSETNVLSLPSHVRCNFRNECLDGRDEKDCHFNTTQCQEGGVLFGYKCIYPYATVFPVSWEDAAKSCSNQFNGHLFSPDTIAELDFVKNLIARDFNILTASWFFGIRDYGGGGMSAPGEGFVHTSKILSERHQGFSTATSFLYRRMQKSSSGVTVFNFLGQYHSAEVSSCRLWTPMLSNAGHHLFSTPCGTPFIPLKETGAYEKVNVVCQAEIANLASTPKPILRQSELKVNESSQTLSQVLNFGQPEPKGEHDLSHAFMRVGDRNDSGWTQRQELFHCFGSREQISITRRCDRVADCFDSSDENDCEAHLASTLMPTRFQCSTGLAISYIHVCDGVNDCLDGQDESFCRSDEEILGKTRVCNNGQSIALDNWCDAKADCLDGSDEFSCEECRSGAVLCPGVGCYPAHWVNDDELDCPFQDKDGHWAMESDFNPHFTEGIPPPAIVLPDGYGKVKLIPLSEQNGSYTTLLCPSTHAQCHDKGYCIPDYMLCNGVKDCPGGEDELLSTCQLFCRDRFRCHGTSICLHESRLCDGWPHCPLHDDETFCPSQHDLPISCPVGCRCSTIRVFEMVCDIRMLNMSATSQGSLKIENSIRNVKYLRLTSNTKVYPSASYLLSLENKLKIVSLRLVKLEVTHSSITEIKVLSAPHLYEIDLSSNQIASLQPNDFINTTEIRILNLTKNSLHDLGFHFLKHLRHLETLDVSFNNLTSVQEFSFLSCPKLKHIMLREMGIRVLSDHAFNGLPSLQYLDLRRNPISKFGPSVLTPLSQLRSLHTDNYRLCCSQVVPDSLKKGNCQAPTDEISSCEDILATEFFRGFLWVVAALTILGNGGVLLYRLVIERRMIASAGTTGRQTQQLGFSTFITSLAASDLLMGIYLCLIGGADIHYRGRYLWAFSEWTRSGFCSFAGFLCFVSSEVSELTIALVTLDRFMALAFPLAENLHFRPLSARLASLIAWTIGITLAAVPLLPVLDEKWNRFYSQNGVCIPLPITRAKFPGKNYSFAVFVVFNLSLFVLIALGQVLVFFAVRSNSMKTQKTNKKQDKGKDGRDKEESQRNRQQQQEAAIARKLALVVASDFLCWMPIGLMGLMSRIGLPISGQAHVAASVFLLPLNAALNPFLYTLGAVLVNRNSKKRPMSSALVKSRDRVGVGKKIMSTNSSSVSKFASTSSNKLNDFSSDITVQSKSACTDEVNTDKATRLKQLEVWLAVGKISVSDIQKCLRDFSKNLKVESHHI
ncbi:G-protein coupled receptor grl101-like [Plakobranchus ocellatus]|uniref:G-protein coupled receptor grl101-like n=1 Tax=Plakobranchus ocellatus TaxID=259542 RepID=A0AAV3YI94_9GAST|nr:G-protein coupled receptor grl101-like [Plakobranchus ocellatus]